MDRCRLRNRPEGANLKEMALAHLGNSRTKWKIKDAEVLDINGIPMVRAAIHEAVERKPDGPPNPPYSIIRYYFLTESKVLAFLHLHGWRNRTGLEDVVKTVKKLH